MENQKPELVESNQNENSSIALDRTKICPFLLRLFWKLDRHNNVNDFVAGMRGDGPYPINEVQIYSWMDATLRELTSLIIAKCTNATKVKKISLSFNLIYLNAEGKPVSRKMGKVTPNAEGSDDLLTLQHFNFVIGDIIDIAVLDPSSETNHQNHRYKQNNTNQRFNNQNNRNFHNRNNKYN